MVCGHEGRGRERKRMICDMNGHDFDCIDHIQTSEYESVILYECVNCLEQVEDNDIDIQSP